MDLTSMNFQLSIMEIALRFLFTLLFALLPLIILFHKRTRISLMQKPIFFIMVSIIVSMILMAVDGSFPRAFGLFAALSIIRFRMPIKDSYEMAVIFYYIAIGITFGAGSFKAGIIGSLCLLIVTNISQFISKQKVSNTNSLLSLTSTASHSNESALKALCDKQNVNIEEIDRNIQSQKLFVNFLISFKDKSQKETFLTSLSSISDENNQIQISQLAENYAHY